jgi:hypothetical protein
MYNRVVDEPRLTAEYRELASAPEPALRVLARSLSRHYGVTYDGVWINLYWNERDSTGWHGAWPTCKRDECIVTVLSLGAMRRFLLKPRSGGVVHCAQSNRWRPRRDGRPLSDGLAAMRSQTSAARRNADQHQFL